MVGCFITIFAAAQDSAKKASIDTSFGDMDIEELFSELDALLDSLTAPKSFLLVNIGMGNSSFSYSGKDYSIQTSRKIAYAPSVGYYSKTGFGVSTTSLVVNDGERLNPFQFYLTGSYDYLKNYRFLAGLAYTRIFTKDSLPFYTSPIQNELYGYFTYKKLWFKPSIAASYGWGSRSAFSQQEEYIQTLRLRMNGFTRVDTKEKINDFNIFSSVRHDFYWMNVMGKKDFIRFTPQLVFTCGTQKFGFNQTSSTYTTLPRTGSNVLYSSDNIYLADQLYFQPLSLTGYLKTEYSKGRFYVQPQLIFDYYFPAIEKNFVTAFVMNAGVIF